jgi:flavin-dependent dehydrogenase
VKEKGLARSQPYDLLIAGGGPAGCAAAIAAAQHKRRALLIEPQGRPKSVACARWVGPAAMRMCRELGVDVAATGASAFSGVRVWPWDLSKPLVIDDAKLKGWIVEPQALGAALFAAAQASGVDVARRSVTGVQRGEDEVVVQLGGERAATGRVLIIADGAATTTAGLAHLPAAHVKSRPGAQAVMNVPDADARLDIILGAGRRIRVATIARGGRQACVTLMVRDSGPPATDQLADLLKIAGDAGLLPAEAAPPPSPVSCLAGVALEMESHVGKRCLLIGDAGGFVSAFSNEGIYAALRSGWLAVQTAARALAVPVSQDELATFSATWRADLADYLRMPNTDLALLLPMVFTNPQMARRLAHAFLLGTPF